MFGDERLDDEDLEEMPPYEPSNQNEAQQVIQETQERNQPYEAVFEQDSDIRTAAYVDVIAAMDTLVLHDLGQILEKCIDEHVHQTAQACIILST